MKRIISFVFAIGVLCSVVISTSALSGGKKYPQNTHNLLSQYNDIDKLFISIEIDTGVKAMSRQEYMWYHGIDLSRYDSDKEYRNEINDLYLKYRNEIANEKLSIMENFFYNEFGAPEGSITGSGGYLGCIGAQLSVSEIKRLESFDKVMGITISTPGNEMLFHGRVEEFTTEMYNEEYLNNTTSELVPVEYYGLDELYALFRGGQKESDEKSEEIIEDFLIIGSPYTHSKDNPTGLFVTTESGVVYTLIEAYDLKVLHMDRLAIRLPYAYIIGDADYDLDITIMDATMIQRLLAGIDEYKDVVCVSRPEDKDRDGNVTIMDATAVQCEIAGR